MSKGKERHSMDRRTFVAGAAAVASLSGPGAALAQTAAPVTLRAASSPVDDVAPVLWGIHNGSFVKAGLDVSLARMEAGAAVTAAVIGGALEIGKSSMLPLISAHFRNLPISIIAPGQLWLTESPITGLIVLKNSPIANAKDLNGKTVATAAIKDLSWVATHAWLDQRGGDSKSVKYVEIPQSAMLDALVQGRIDAATLTNPSFAAAVSSGKVKIVGATDDGIAKHFMLTAWFASNDYIAKNPSTIARFAQLVMQNAAYTNTHPSDAIPLIAGFSQLDPAELAHGTHSLCGTRIDAGTIQPIIDAAYRYQVIDQHFDAQEMFAKI